MPLQSSGIFSGIDSAGLISQLVNVEKRNQDPVQRSKAAAKAESNAILEFNTKLTSLLSSIKALDGLDEDGKKVLETGTEVLGTDVKSSSDSSVGVSATGLVTPGSYVVENVVLATAARRDHSGTAEKDTSLSVGDAVFAFKYGTNDVESIAITGGTTTLEDVRDSINALEKGVRASIIDTGVVGANRYRLVLDGEDVGMDNTVSIDATTTLTGFAEVDFGTTAPLNSSLDVNGITVTGSSNNVEIIDGLTVNLKTVPDDPVTISATRDTGALKTKLEAIVEKANAFLGFLAEQSEYDAKTKTAGVLSGDALATGIGRKVRTAFGLEVSGGVHQSLGDLGISFNSEGRVELDDSVLKTALDENPLAVRDLLRSTNVTEPNGLMSKLSSVLSPYTEEEGPLKTRLETLDSIVERADERLLALNARSEKYRVRLEAQFLRMEQSLAALSGTQSFFATNQIGLY